MILIIIKLLNTVGLVLTIIGSILISSAINKSKTGLKFNFGDGPMDPVFLTKPSYIKHGLTLIILGFIMQFIYTIYFF